MKTMAQEEQDVVRQSLKALRAPIDQIHQDEEARSNYAKQLLALERWLKQQFDHANHSDATICQQISETMKNWHQQLRTMPSIPSAIVWQWLSCVIWLDLLDPNDENPLLQSFVDASCSLHSFVPRVQAFCDLEPHVEWFRQLLRVVSDPWCAVTASQHKTKMHRLLAVWLHCLNALMRDHEIVLFSQLGHDLIMELTQFIGNEDYGATVAVEFASQHVGTLTSSHPVVGCVCLLLSISSSMNTAFDQAQEILEQVRVQIIQQLIQPKESYQDLHHPVWILGVVLGLSSESNARSKNAVILQAFAQLRCVISLPRLSFQLVKEQRLLPAVDLGLVVQHPTSASTLLALVRNAVNELIQFYRGTSRELYTRFLQTLKQSAENQPFREPLVEWMKETDVDDQDHDAIQRYVVNSYRLIAHLVHALHADGSNTVDCFLVMNRLDFVLATSLVSMDDPCVRLYIELNRALQAVMEQSPDAILSSLLQSYQEQQTKSTVIPAAFDVIDAYARLSIGLFLQRNLRLLLFQCPDQLVPILSFVFDALYSGVVDLDAFAHQFLHFAMQNDAFASRTQGRVASDQLIPYYGLVTLQQYPTHVTKTQVADTMARLAGSLLYGNKNATLLVWLITQCLARVHQLASSHSNVPKLCESALYLVEVVMEIVKVVPLPMLRDCLQPVHQFVAKLTSPVHTAQVKTKILECIMHHCEAEKRAWLAAWLIKLDQANPLQQARL